MIGYRNLLLCLFVSAQLLNTSSNLIAGENNEGEQNVQNIVGEFIQFVIRNEARFPETRAELHAACKKFTDQNGGQFAENDMKTLDYFLKDTKMQHALLSKEFWDTATRNSISYATKEGTKTLVDMFVKYTLQSTGFDNALTLQQRQQKFNELKGRLDNITQTLNGGQFSGSDKEFIKKIYIKTLQQMDYFDIQDSPCDHRQSCKKMQGIIEAYKLYRLSHPGTTDANTRVEEFARRVQPLVRKHVTGGENIPLETTPLYQEFEQEKSRFTKEELAALTLLNRELFEIGDDVEASINDMKLKTGDTSSNIGNRDKEFENRKKQLLATLSEPLKQFSTQFGGKVQDQHGQLIDEGLNEKPGVVQETISFVNDATNLTFGGVTMKKWGSALIAATVIMVKFVLPLVGSIRGA